MSRSEFDANQSLLAVEPDPLEQTQRMPVVDRRFRMAEARQQRVDGVVDELAALRGWSDFREGGRHTLTVHERNQQDGFSHDE